MTKLFAFARRSRRALRVHGFGGAVRLAAATLTRPRTPEIEHTFDQRYGVDTSGIVRLEGLTVRGDPDLGVRYQASEPDVVLRRLNDLPIRVEEFVFVDIGSGKGRAVLVAAHLPFKSVIGVEYCEELHAVALANVAAFPSSARAAGGVRLVCIDAAAFEFPPEPLVLYFYNPFLEPLMQQVMSNLRASLAQQPRPVYIVMTGDLTLAGVVRAHGFRELAEGLYTSTGG